MCKVLEIDRKSKEIRAFSVGTAFDVYASTLLLKAFLVTSALK